MFLKRHLFQSWTLTGVLAGLVWIVPQVYAAAGLELYGTFHAMGVIVTLDPSDDPDEDAVAAVAYRSGNDTFKTGFPLSRVASSRWVGSLFWLQPGTAYDVRVTITDPDHGPLDQTTLQSSSATRPEIVIPAPDHSLDIHLVLADGKRLFPCKSKNDLISLSWDGTPGIFQDRDTLYVSLENDKYPGEASMIASRFGTAFTVTQDYICFINLTFKHYGQCSNLSLMAAIVCSIRLKKKPGILNTAQQTAARECRHRVLSC